MTLLTTPDVATAVPAGFELPEFHARLQQEVRAFADEVVAPAAYEYDTKRELPIAIVAAMGDMGLFGLPIPAEYGGQGRDYLALCLAVEQLARADQSIAGTPEAGGGGGGGAPPPRGPRAPQERGGPPPPPPPPP